MPKEVRFTLAGSVLVPLRYRLKTFDLLVSFGHARSNSCLRRRVVATKRTSEPCAERTASEWVGWGGVGGGMGWGWGFEVLAIDFARSKNRSERVNSVMDYKGRRDARQRKEYYQLLPNTTERPI